MNHSVLVYNITHSDLILGVEAVSRGVCSTLFCKPKFSFVEEISSQAFQRIGNIASPSSSSLLKAPFSDKTLQAPVGFSFPHPFTAPASALHFRGNSGGGEGEVKITQAYVPLAAQIFPAWIARNERASPSPSQRHIFLLCGAGRPQDTTASLTGNSTRWTAEIIATFLRQFLLADEPKTKITILDSTADIDLFDYHGNVRFVHKELLPKMEALRREVAAEAEPASWRQGLDLTIALTQGSPARIQAVSAALAPFRPSYAHLRQLKTFWHERVLLERDLEFLSFDEFATLPSIPAGELGERAYRLVVEEMKVYRDEFIRAATERDNELSSFWLRKSHRPVLSVLLVREEEGEGEERYTLHRGINLEVSQPTGSLCSERNAIGTALVLNPNLKRKNFMLVAVLALGKLVPDAPAAAAAPSSSSSNNKRARSSSFETTVMATTLNPLGPCGACMEWLKKIAEVNPDFKVMTFKDLSCEQVFVREVVD